MDSAVPTNDFERKWRLTSIIIPHDPVDVDLPSEEFLDRYAKSMSEYAAHLAKFWGEPCDMVATLSRDGDDFVVSYEFRAHCIPPRSA